MARIPDDEIERLKKEILSLAKIPSGQSLNR